MKAYELLDSASKWTQKAFARDRVGEPVTVGDKRAVQWCIVGAVNLCYPDFSEWSKKTDKLRYELYSKMEIDRSLSSWNDDGERTYEEVYELLKSNNV